MSLAAEREILKQIHKLNILRRQISESVQHNQQINEKKAMVSTLRDSLKGKRTDISEIKIELSTVSTAASLGCEVKDLVGRKIDCPAEKIGNVLGKKGKNIQELMSTNNVNVNIDKSHGDIRLIGTFESLDAAISKLDQVIAQTEDIVEISMIVHQYLTSANIVALTQLRERHPSIYVSFPRSAVDETDVPTVQQVRVRGIRTDIAAFQCDLMNIECISTDLHVSSRDAGLLVGKGGSTIADLVKAHQATINLQRPTKNGENNIATVDVSTKVTISGPPANVEAAKVVIEAMIEMNKDLEELVPLDLIVKAVLLLNNGAGVQAIQKLANVASRELCGDSPNSNVSINVNDADLVVKGKSNVLKVSMKHVHDEVERIMSLSKRITIDKFAIPVLIGKGGQGIKDLKEGTKTVYLNVNREVGEIEICGLDEEELNKVVQAVSIAINDNQVHRLRVELDDTRSANSFSDQFRKLSRSAVMKQLKDLVFIMADDSTNELVLRGKPENLVQSIKLIQEFLDSNFIGEIGVFAEEISALLTGGKKSKIVELANSTGVSLSVDKDRKLIQVKGQKSKVIDAIQAIREFLCGSADVAVIKVPVNSEELMGVVIGKAGKTKADLQAKFPLVSIVVHRTDALVTLRGDPTQAEQCRTEITTLLLNANITRTFDLSEQHLEEVQTSKFIQRIGQTVPVKVLLNKEKKIVSFRGVRADVEIALSLLKENLVGIYESTWNLESILYKKMHDACSNPTHLGRIEQQSGAKVVLDDNLESIVLSGTRETVKTAKKDLLVLLEFVYGCTMRRRDVPAEAFPKMGKSNFMNEIITKTGTHAIADQDTNTIMIFSMNAEKVEDALTLIDEKLNVVEKQICVWQFNVSDDWLVSNIIGKNGQMINKLRKDTRCLIDLDSKDRRMVVSAGDIDILEKGKEIIDSFISKSRKECVVVVLSELDTPVFIGKVGKHMKAFKDKYNVEVTLVNKNDVYTIRITGQEDKVAAAKTGLDEWLASRSEQRKDAEGMITKKVKPNDIPVIIGTKGGTIRGLEREFGCKVKIDRQTSTVTVTGGSSTKRLALLEKIDITLQKYDVSADTKTDLDSTLLTTVTFVGDVIEETDGIVSSTLEQMD
jgi:polyribonucleotide nucleotidyltransferase